MKKSNRLLIIIGITVVALFIISAAIFRYRISRHNRKISIKGNNCSYNALKLDINGGADINLKDVPVKDARIHLSGAANIVLSLKGGKLEGDISGAGMLKYYGTVKVKNIRTSGAVKIKQG
ncbi:MAG: hypothetical protein DRP57_04580 [Spirochaetes bacterium]|nr:MAG: hypothetical protein DRP57_04580 [Spirochaetota bacterium]